MNTITFTPSHYLINGVPTYLNSGEFHYFRVPRADWQERMGLFKQAGGNVLATYIPWLLHEPEEGRFAWGETADHLDLEGFLQTARAQGLYVIARPGPYQYSELVYDGLPGWLCNGYPDLLARNRQGKIFRNSSVSYVHPLFWKKIRQWYAAVCPILARYTVMQDGPIAFLQIDNELVGIHEWFGGLDYNQEAMGFGRPDGRFPRWLAGRYTDIGALNDHYGSAYASFAAVEPPMTGDDLHTIRRRADYFHFYLGTVADYARFLVDQVRAYDIQVPIVHNSAHPGMNAYFMETAAVLGDQFLLGSDHYYSLDQTWAQNHPTPQYAARCFVSLEMLRLMGYPPTVFELPGGSCSDWPPITPSDALACYLTNLAFGMKGHNYYIFTGGPNPPGAGATTDLYDYNASIGPAGEIRPLFEAQKAFGQVLAEHPWLVTAWRLADFRLAVDLEYSRTDHYWTGGGPGLSPKQAWDLLRTGPLTTALCAGLSPEMVRLDASLAVQPVDLPLVVVAGASMAAIKQQALVDFLKAGGKVLILPVLPWLDEHLRPCTLLAEFLGVTRAALQPLPSPTGVTRPTIAGVSNVRGEVAGLWQQLPPGAELVGIEEHSGRPIAWKSAVQGGGQILVLSFAWLHAMREQVQMLLSLLGQLGCRPRVHTTNPNVWVTTWTTGEKTVVFLLNLFSAPLETTVEVRLPDGRVKSIGPHALGPVTVKLVDI